MSKKLPDWVINHPTTCPHCGKVNPHTATEVEPGARPSDGDPVMCIGCGQFAMFDARAPGGLSALDADTAAFVASDPEAQRLRAQWLLAGRLQ